MRYLMLKNNSINTHPVDLKPTTVGRITYTRPELLFLRNSPLAKAPPAGMVEVPDVTNVTKPPKVKF